MALLQCEHQHRGLGSSCPGLMEEFMFTHVWALHFSTTQWLTWTIPKNLNLLRHVRNRSTMNYLTHTLQLSNPNEKSTLNNIKHPYRCLLTHVGFAWSYDLPDSRLPSDRPPPRLGRTPWTVPGWMRHCCVTSARWAPPCWCDIGRLGHR